MEYKNNMDEKELNSPNIDKILYLKQQLHIIEKARQLIEKGQQIVQFQGQVIKIEHDKWNEMDSCIEPMQGEIDWYVKEYIIPIQEKEKELNELENSLINVPQKQGIFGKVGKFFEKFMPGITKEGRQKRNIEDRRQTIQSEIDSYKLMIERNPFQVFGGNKDVKSEILARIDVNQLDKYSTVQNSFRDNLKSNNSVKSVVDNIEAFNLMVSKMFKDTNQEKKDLIDKVDLGIGRDTDKDILSNITQQIQNLKDDLTPDELEKIEQIEQRDTPQKEL